MARTLVQIIQDEEALPGRHRRREPRRRQRRNRLGLPAVQAGQPVRRLDDVGLVPHHPPAGRPGWTYKDFTHVGLLATDDALLLVDGKSNIKTFEDWVSFAKDKGKVVVGGIGTVNVDFILQSLIAEHAGYEIEYVPYNEEGQVQTSLLVRRARRDDVQPGKRSSDQVESGDMTPVLFTGNQRLQALPDVPTGEEKGMNDLPSMPRGVILPPDAPDYARDWWIKTMKQVVESAAVEDVPRRQLPHRERQVGSTTSPPTSKPPPPSSSRR